MREFFQEKWVKWVSLIAISVVLLFLLQKYLLTMVVFLLPFIIIIAMTMILKIPVDYLETKKVPRWLGTLMSLISLLTVLLGLLSVAIIQLINGSKSILQSLTTHSADIIKYTERIYIETITPLVETAKEGFSVLNDVQKEELRARAIGIGENILQGITNVLQKFLEFIPEFIGVLPGLFAGLVFVSLATFFLTKDFPQIKNNFKKLLTSKQIMYVRQINKEIKKTVLGYIRAQFILIGMTAVVVWIGLTILGVEYAFLIALGVGFVDLIPYLGTGFILWPWTAYLFLIGDTKVAIGLLILYVVIVIQRNIVEPKVLSTNIGVDPLSTLVAIYLGLVIYGPIGLLFGPMILIAIKMIWNMRQIEKDETIESTP